VQIFEALPGPAYAIVALVVAVDFVDFIAEFSEVGNLGWVLGGREGLGWVWEVGGRWRGGD
jgi:hypothetical protein